MSKHPGRISLNAVGSIPYSSLGLPATAFNPMLGIDLPVELPDVAAVGEALHPGRPVLELDRQPALEKAGWLDQMVDMKPRP